MSLKALKNSAGDIHVDAQGNILMVEQAAPTTGVTSIGGATGDITLGSGLSMTGNELSASGGSGGGTQLYRHSIPVSMSEGGSIVIVLQIVSTQQTPYDNFGSTAGQHTLQHDSSKFAAYMYGMGTENAGLLNYIGLGSYNGSSMAVSMPGSSETVTIYAPEGGFSDTVTAL